MGRFQTVDRRQEHAENSHGIPEHAAPAVLDALTNLHTAIGQFDKSVRGDRAVLTTGAVNRPVPAAGGKVSSSAGRLAGWSFRDLSGTGSVLRIRDGFDTTGDILAVTVLAANASETHGLTPGVGFALGLVVEVVSGSVEGSVWLAGGRA